MEIPRRSDVIREFQRHGGKVAVVTPILYPRALLRGHGFLPVEMWGPPGLDTSLGDTHLQAYTCSIVRSILSFILNGGIEKVDALVMPHGCDSLQGLTSVLQNFVDPHKPIVPLYMPKSSGRLAVQFMVEEFKAAGRLMTEVSGVQPDDQTLMKAVMQEEEADALALRLLVRDLPASQDARPLYALLRSREFLPVESFVTAAAEFLPQTGGSLRGVPVILSGVVPEPMQVLSAMQEAGARIVGDDLACTGRRALSPGNSADPWERMAEAMASAPPDPMRGSPVAARVDRLKELARTTGAKGVVFLVVKYCEPELFDIPVLQQALRADGLRTLVLEVEVNQALPMQTISRLEAFCETLT